MALHVILLVTACLTAFARPVWGFGIILLTTSTLFHLEQYLTVPLPIGYIEPTEALLATMLVSLWLKRSDVVSRRNKSKALVSGRHKLPLGSVLATAGLYCLWLTFCILFGLTQWTGAEHFRFGLRFWLSGVLPWVSLYILAKLSVEDTHKIFKAAYYLMLLTACVHIALQVTNFRPAMDAAYWFSPPNDEGVSLVKQQIDQGAEFVRGLPQGLHLILFFTLLKLAEYVFARGRRRNGNLIAVIILFSALAIIFSRSLMIVLAVGIIVLVGLAALTLRVNVGHAVRIASILAFFVGAVLLYDAVRPGFLEFWSERIELFVGVDSRIFSEENKARGLDNLSAWKTIRDYPIFGVGMGYIPEGYSLKDESSNDIHPILQIGLAGGMPAILLVVLLQVGLFLPSLKNAFSHPLAALQLLPFLSVLIMNTIALNIAGGGGTLFGPQILFVAIFANEMWNRCPPASAVDGRRYVRPRMEKDDAVEAAAHFSPNTLL